MLEDNWINVKESKKLKIYLDLARGLKNNLEHESDSKINGMQGHLNISKDLVKKGSITWGLE